VLGHEILLVRSSSASLTIAASGRRHFTQTG
jgi:hypothetical protein